MPGFSGSLAALGRVPVKGALKPLEEAGLAVPHAPSGPLAQGSPMSWFYSQKASSRAASHHGWACKQRCARVNAPALGVCGPCGLSL